MKKLQLNNRDLLENFLRHVAADSVSLLEKKDEMELARAAQNEKERQARMARDIEKDVPKGVKQSDDVEEAEDDEEETDPKEEEPQAEEKPEEKTNGLPKHVHTDLPDAADVTVDMVKDRLNIIRSGQSFRDERVAVEMNHYFQSLSDPERLALLSFLTGIAQVVTAGVEGEDAPDPGDPEVGVHVIDSPNKKTPAKKSPGKPAPKKKAGGENTAPPIQVGQRQATENIRRRIRKLL